MRVAVTAVLLDVGRRASVTGIANIHRVYIRCNFVQDRIVGATGEGNRAMAERWTMQRRRAISRSLLLDAAGGVLLFARKGFDAAALEGHRRCRRLHPWCDLLPLRQQRPSCFRRRRTAAPAVPGRFRRRRRDPRATRRVARRRHRRPVGRSAGRAGSRPRRWATSSPSSCCAIRRPGERGVEPARGDRHALAGLHRQASRDSAASSRWAVDLA